MEHGVLVRVIRPRADVDRFETTGRVLEHARALEGPDLDLHAASLFIPRHTEGSTDALPRGASVALIDGTKEVVRRYHVA